VKLSKRRKLEAAGWKVGSAKEFLGLNDEEAEKVELEVEREIEKRRRKRSKRGC
jgi:hypothetical protein